MNPAAAMPIRRLTLASFNLPPPRPAAALQSRIARYAVPQRDAVSVFVDDGCITLIVRDGGLSESDAFDAVCAVVRRLVGHASGLRRVTIDGRRGYRVSLGPVPATTSEC